MKNNRYILISQNLVLPDVVVVIQSPGPGALQALVRRNIEAESADITPPGMVDQISLRMELCLERIESHAHRLDDVVDQITDIGIGCVLLLNALVRLLYAGIPIVVEFSAALLALEWEGDRQLVGHIDALVAGLAEVHAQLGDRESSLNDAQLVRGGQAAAGKDYSRLVAHVGSVFVVAGSM